MAQPLKTEVVDPIRFRHLMLSYGAQYMPDRSNERRHVYFSRRLNRWYAVSQKGGAVTINHYPECPCALSI